MYILIETTNNINNHKFIDIIKDNDNKNFFGSNPIIKRALSIFYPENFSREIIDSGTKEEMEKAFENYATLHRIFYNPNYYNCPRTQEEKQQYLDYSNKLACEEFKKWRAENKHIYQTEEFRRILSEANKGEKNSMYGKKHSEETKKLMSKNRKGKTIGEKNGNYGMKGEKAKNGKQIYQFEDEEHTKLIKKFNTVGLVLDYLDLKGHSRLMKAIKENKKYRGYYWSR